jgi:hypothetical protein
LQIWVIIKVITEITVEIAAEVAVEVNVEINTKVSMEITVVAAGVFIKVIGRIDRYGSKPFKSSNNFKLE